MEWNDKTIKIIKEAKLKHKCKAMDTQQQEETYGADGRRHQNMMMMRRQ